MPLTIDLNCDLGEGFGVWRLGEDEALLDLVTSANVACGFHAGDPVIMRRVCERAVARGVAIGAQVGYRDLAGFGRRAVDVEPDELSAEVLYQLGALSAFAVAAGDRVRYLKPHGALYHRTAVDPGQAAAVVAAARAFRPGLPVLGPPNSVLLRLAARAGLEPIPEGFADRGYRPDGTLVPRGEAAAVLTDPVAVADRVRRLAVEKRVLAADGTLVDLPVRSICVHGDTPDAVAIARAVVSTLDESGVATAAFAD